MPPTNAQCNDCHHPFNADCGCGVMLNSSLRDRAPRDHVGVHLNSSPAAPNYCSSVQWLICVLRICAIDLSTGAFAYHVNPPLRDDGEISDLTIPRCTICSHCHEKSSLHQRRGSRSESISGNGS